MPKRLLLFVPVLLLVLLAGCRNAPVALAGVGRLAVLTPENYTDCPEIAAEIKNELLARLPGRIAAEVIDGAPFEAGMLPTPAEVVMGARAADLGRQYGIDAFILGEVTAYDESHREHLRLAFGSESDFSADFKVDLAVDLAFNLRLVRAADGATLIYRQAAESATEVFSFGLGRPYISFTVSVQPLYPQLRREAARNAVRDLLRKLARESV
ncbi:MAG: hypothetical protein ACM3ZC_04315 [Bacteroidota bacterium]